MPTTVSNDDTVVFQVGLWMVIVSAVLVPLQMVPGWAIVDLNWPTWSYYILMCGCWGVGFALMASAYGVPGVLGGVVAGAGCLFALTTLLENTTWTHSIILMVVGGIGALPGLMLYLGLCKLQDLIIPPPQEVLPPPPDAPQDALQDRADPERPTGIQR